MNRLRGDRGRACGLQETVVKEMGFDGEVLCCGAVNTRASIGCALDKKKIA